jgi:large subunit ribosomal protein L25
MNKPTIKAEKREILGRKVNKLRKEGKIPANLYGKKIKSESIQVKQDEFKKIWEEVGETTLLKVDVEGKIHPVLIHNVQIHPLTREFLHIDFHEVSLTEKTTAKIPVELEGESPAVKQSLGVLLQTLSELEVEALPADLPEKLTIDISGLAEVDNQVVVGDIKIDSDKIKILVDPAEVVAKIVGLQKEEVVVPPPSEEAPAEGESSPVREAPTGEENGTESQGNPETPAGSK